MLVDKQNDLMSDLLFTVHQHGSFENEALENEAWRDWVGGVM